MERQDSDGEPTSTILTSGNHFSLTFSKEAGATIEKHTKNTSV
jgi:hypothetical protein